MHRRTLSNVQRGLATAIVFAAVFACGGGSSDSTAPTSTGGDTLRFSYSSARGSGSFSVHQGQAGNATMCTPGGSGQTYACAWLHGSGDYWIEAAQANDASTSTVIWIVLDPVHAPATLALGSSCTTNCTSIMTVNVNSTFSITNGYFNLRLRGT